MTGQVCAFGKLNFFRGHIAGMTAKCSLVTAKWTSRTIGHLVVLQQNIFPVLIGHFVIDQLDHFVPLLDAGHEAIYHLEGSGKKGTLETAHALLAAYIIISIAGRKIVFQL